MERSKRIIIILTVAVLVVLCLSFLVKHRTDERLTSVFESKENLVSFEKRTSGLNEIRKELETNQEGFAIVESVFLDNDSLVDFIKELEYLAAQCGVEIKIRNVSFREGGQGDVPFFGLNLSGDFSSVYRYVFLLENSKYQVSVDRVNFQNADGGKMWEANLDISILSFISND